MSICTFPDFRLRRFHKHAKRFVSRDWGERFFKINTKSLSTASSGQTSFKLSRNVSIAWFVFHNPLISNWDASSWQLERRDKFPRIVVDLRSVLFFERSHLFIRIFRLLGFFKALRLIHLRFGSVVCVLRS